MNPSRTAGTDAIRVSPLRSILRQTGTRIEPVDGVEVSGMGVELEALADLSTCDRLGLKGRGVAAWLQAQAQLLALLWAVFLLASWWPLPLVWPLLLLCPVATAALLVLPMWPPLMALNRLPLLLPMLLLPTQP